MMSTIQNVGNKTSLCYPKLEYFRQMRVGENKHKLTKTKIERGMVEVGQPWNEFNWLIQARSEWRNFWTSCIDVKYSQTDRSVRDLGSQRYLLGTSASHCLQKRGLPDVF